MYKKIVVSINKSGMIRKRQLAAAIGVCFVLINRVSVSERSRELGAAACRRDRRMFCLNKQSERKRTQSRTGCGSLPPQLAAAFNLNLDIKKKIAIINYVIGYLSAVMRKRAKITSKRENRWCEVFTDNCPG